VIVLLCLVAFSCKRMGRNQANANPLRGQWHISAAYRNDRDITDGSDFTKFLLEVDEDGTYIIKENLNLPLAANGYITLEPHKKVQNINIVGENGRLGCHMTLLPMDGERNALLAFDFVSSSNTGYHYVFRKYSL